MYKVNDEYTLKAKKEGWLARSVYKLQEIDKKYKLINQGNVLDLGAAPGSWSQYVLKHLKKGFLVSLDLNDLSISQNSNFKFIKGDLRADETLLSVKDFAPFSLLLSDIAPKTTGNRLIDTRASFELVESILKLYLCFLKEGGSIVLKIFQGGEENIIFNLLKSSFRELKRERPRAVRKNSFEIYFVGRGYVKNN